MRRVLAAWDEHLVHPRSAARLGRLLREAGFSLPGADRVPIVNAGYDPDTYSAGLIGFIAAFVPGRLGLTDADAEAWAQDLRALGRGLLLQPQPLRVPGRALRIGDADAPGMRGCAGAPARPPARLRGAGRRLRRGGARPRGHPDRARQRRAGAGHGRQAGRPGPAAQPARAPGRAQARGLAGRSRSSGGCARAAATACSRERSARAAVTVLSRRSAPPSTRLYRQKHPRDRLRLPDHPRRHQAGDRRPPAGGRRAPTPRSSSTRATATPTRRAAQSSIAQIAQPARLRGRRRQHARHRLLGRRLRLLRAAAGPRRLRRHRDGRAPAVGAAPQGRG